MKKYTISEFAKVIRNKYPGKYDSVSDNDLVFKWLKVYYADAKYIDVSELTKLGLDLGKESVKKNTEVIKDKIVDKLGGQPAVDSTLQTVKDKLKNVYTDIKKNYNDQTSNNTDDSQNTDLKTNTTTNTSTNDDDKVIVTKYDPVTNKHEGLTTKKCDNFPFTIGCINPKIGMLNNIYFGDPMDNVYSKVLYNALYSDANFGMPGEKDGVISQTLYDRVIKNSQKQNESINKKSVIKQTVKKVLKERLNKK
jgi:hypothetical protein